MGEENTQETTLDKYPIIMRVLHWFMGLTIIGLLAVGLYMEGLEKEDPIKDTLYYWHKAFGCLILILFFVRILVRQLSKVPPLPKGIKKIEKLAAHGAHIALYLLILLVPLSGYLMSNSYGYGVNMFGIDMPVLFEKDYDIGKLARQWHGWFAYAIIAVILAHVGGALKHKFFDKKENDVLNRML